jgi:hypothetical protein
MSAVSLTNTLPPLKPSQRVPPRADFALFILVNHLDWDKSDFITAPRKLHDEIRLNFEMLRGDRESHKTVQIHQTKATLRIWNDPSRQTGNFPAHHPVRPFSDPRHSLMASRTVPHNEAGTGSSREEFWDVGGGMLSVPIEAKGPGKTTFEQQRPAPSQSRPFATVPFQTHYFGAARASLICGLVGRPVVYHQDCGQMRAYFTHQSPNGPFLISTRNESGALTRPVHASRLPLIC